MKNGTTAAAAPAPQKEDNASATGTPNEKIESASSAKKSKRGGKRPGSGRKPKAERAEVITAVSGLDAHVTETVEVTIRDPRAGTSKTIAKPRIVVAMEKLFERATKGEGETQALDKWLDRALGKAPQSLALKHSGEIATTIKKQPSKAALAAKRAYAANLKD